MTTLVRISGTFRSLDPSRRGTPLRSAAVTVRAAISAVDEPKDRFDLVAADGEGFAGGIDNVGDDPPAISTVDDSTAADGTTADELLEASDTVLSATGDDFDAAVLSAVIAADDAAATAVLTIDSLATETANSADPGEDGVGSRPSRAVASSVYRSIASFSGFIGFPESPPKGCAERFFRVAR